MNKVFYSAITNKYCNIGDQLTVITAFHPNVWIVEKEPGNRFSFKPENLVSEKPVDQQQVEEKDPWQLF